MKAIKTNLEPFLDWFSYTYKFSNNTTFKDFSNYVTLINPEFLNNGKLKIKEVLFLDKQEYLKLEFSATFFKKRKVVQNIKEIETFLKYFHKVLKVHNMFDKSTISRIDLSANDYVNSFQNKFFVKTKMKQEVTRFYRNNNVLKGIAIGKRGKNFIYYKCYDKREDTSKAREKATIRFGTYTFLRHEYEIGRKFLREKNINFETDFKKLWDYLFNIKRVDFNYIDNGNKKIFTNIFRHKEDKKKLIKQVIGIIRNNLMDERTEIVKQVHELG